MATQLARPVPEPSTYDDDFYGWCLEQAALVRAGRLSELDRENVAEELESLGKEQAHSLESSYRVLLLQLLKWRYQHRKRSRSWAGTIVRERINAAKRLVNNRGLEQHKRHLFAEAYGGARREAAAETGLRISVFPADCPFTFEQALDDEFWPEAEAA
jgi:hypothetical protein